MYKKLITDYKLLTVILILLVTIFFASQIPKFKLDASSDTLVLDGNENLEYYSKTKDRYGSDDYLIITLSPKEKGIISNLFLKNLSEIQRQIKHIKNVDTITSILNAPLIKSPHINLSDLSSGKIISIEKSNYSNIDDVLNELKTHPIYENVLVSSDAKTTAILVNFDNSSNEDIEKIRDILKPYKDSAEIYIGGVPMIVADSIAYIDNDIKTFGVGVILFIILLLAISFRKLVWILIPVINSAVICIIMIGLLGFLNWPVTVVSSNFISLLLIISISLSIHLIVKYEELLKKGDLKTQQELVLKTIRKKFIPCFYTAITTMVAFTSLIISDVKPIINFGWMMVLGIVISFVIIFTLMPCLLNFCKLANQKNSNSLHKKITDYIYSLTYNYSKSLLVLFSIIIVVGIYGILQLSVQNRFIDYFKESTEIYQGMKVIDENLGGTTPMDVIINAPKSFQADEYSDGENYWYGSFILEDVALMHDYLDTLPETGKVLSLNSSISLLKELNNGDVDSFLLAVIKNKIPENLKEIMLNPYLSEDGNQLRFSVRIYESIEGLDRQELISKIKTDMVEKFSLKEEDIRITGMLVLYNDLLQSLFRSQILTIGAVFLAIGGMFLILFRSIRFSIIALIPNIVAAVSVLGLMGLLGISLDIMTITIAAICLGIAVDDTIHYIYRFREEFTKDGNAWNSIKRAHNTIGRAIYLTTITITLGFSILALSDFVPTIYFGLLTGFSMLIALLADLILLPILLTIFVKNKS